MTSSPRFEQAVRDFDAAHVEDPERVSTSAGERPWSVHYHARLAHWVDVLAPDASEPLRLAARCQHIRRWSIPRSDFPEGPLGYKKWRSTLALFHADEAESALRAAGYDDSVVERVRALLIKKGLKSDAEVMAFEDAICLTFLENQLASFATRHERDKLIDILQKTWAKMTPRGHAVAMDLAAGLPGALKALVQSAVAPEDAGFMREAIAEGKKAFPACLPNPPVGCVLVRDGAIIARGHTQPPFEHHAEPMALSQVEGPLEDVTAYVTLEPCSFHQRTPSCAKEMIARKVGRVFVAMIDPHPRNQGRGLEMLREAGVEVVADFLTEEARPHLEPHLYAVAGPHPEEQQG